MWNGHLLMIIYFVIRTRILQYSLGGNAKTSLILTVTPTETEASESHSTLQFGQRAMKIEIKARLNVIPDYKLLYESLQVKLPLPHNIISFVAESI